MQEGRTMLWVACVAGLIWLLSPNPSPVTLPESVILPPAKPLPPTPIYTTAENTLPGAAETETEIKLEFRDADMNQVNKAFIRMGGQVLIFDAIRQHFSTLDRFGNLISAQQLDIDQNNSVVRDMTAHLGQFTSLPAGTSEVLYIWPEPLWQRITGRVGERQGLTLIHVDTIGTRLRFTPESINGQSVTPAPFYI